jgi:hypothetical protein
LRWLCTSLTKTRGELYGFSAHVLVPVRGHPEKLALSVTDDRWHDVKDGEHVAGTYG